MDQSLKKNKAENPSMSSMRATDQTLYAFRFSVTIFWIFSAIGEIHLNIVKITGPGHFPHFCPFFSIFKDQKRPYS